MTGAATQPISVGDEIEEALDTNRSRDRRPRSLVRRQLEDDVEEMEPANTEIEAPQRPQPPRQPRAQQQAQPQARQRVTLTWKESFQLVDFVRRSKVGNGKPNWDLVHKFFIQAHAPAAHLSKKNLQARYNAIRDHWRANEAAPPTRENPDVIPSVYIGAFNRLNIDAADHQQEWADQLADQQERWAELGRMIRQIENESTVDSSERRRSSSQLRSSASSMRIERAALRGQSIRALNSAVRAQTVDARRQARSSRATDLLAFTNAQLAVANTTLRLRELSQAMTPAEREEIEFQQRNAARSSQIIADGLKKLEEEEKDDDDEDEQEEKECGCEKEAEESD